MFALNFDETISECLGSSLNRLRRQGLRLAQEGDWLKEVDGRETGARHLSCT